MKKITLIILLACLALVLFNVFFAVVVKDLDKDSMMRILFPEVFKSSMQFIFIAIAGTLLQHSTGPGYSFMTKN